MVTYTLLLQISKQLNVRAYSNKENKDFLAALFTPDSYELLTLEETYCNHEKIPFEMFKGSAEDLLNDVVYREGRILTLWPGNDDYRADLQDGKEHNKMLRAAMTYISENLKFLPQFNEKALETLKKVEKKLRKRKNYCANVNITYVGIHNRRTDFTKYADQMWSMEELDEDYFYKAMDTYRYRSK